MSRTILCLWLGVFAKYLYLPLRSNEEELNEVSIVESPGEAVAAVAAACNDLLLKSVDFWCFSAGVEERFPIESDLFTSNGLAGREFEVTLDSTVELFNFWLSPASGEDGASDFVGVAKRLLSVVDPGLSVRFAFNGDAVGVLTEEYKLFFNGDPELNFAFIAGDETGEEERPVMFEFERIDERLGEEILLSGVLFKYFGGE